MTSRALLHLVATLSLFSLSACDGCVDRQTYEPWELEALEPGPGGGVTIEEGELWFANHLMGGESDVVDVYVNDELVFEGLRRWHASARTIDKPEGAFVVEARTSNGARPLEQWVVEEGEGDFVVLAGNLETAEHTAILAPHARSLTNDQVGFTFVHGAPFREGFDLRLEAAWDLVVDSARYPYASEPYIRDATVNDLPFEQGAWFCLAFTDPGSPEADEDPFRSRVYNMYIDVQGYRGRNVVMVYGEDPERWRWYLHEGEGPGFVVEDAL